MGIIKAKIPKVLKVLVWPANMVFAPADPFFHWWKKACRNLKITGVSLYPGTKHSTATGMRKLGYTPEQIKVRTGHRTSPSFCRYFMDDEEEKRAMVDHLASATKVKPSLEDKREFNTLILQERMVGTKGFEPLTPTVSG